MTTPGHYCHIIMKHHITNIIPAVLHTILHSHHSHCFSLQHRHHNSNKTSTLEISFCKTLYDLKYELWNMDCKTIQALRKHSIGNSDTLYLLTSNNLTVSTWYNYYNSHSVLKSAYLQCSNYWQMLLARNF